MEIEPLWVVVYTITVLPLADKRIRDIRDQVVALQVLVAAGEVRVGLQELCPYELQLTMVDVEVSMYLQFLWVSHGQKLTPFPEACIFI